MVVTCDVSNLSADCKAFTTEGAVGTITMPSNAKRVIGIGVYVSGVTTTVNPMSGIFRVSCNSLDITPGRFPIKTESALTSGAVTAEPRIWAVNWEKVENAVFSFFITVDVSLTGVTYARAFIMYEKG